MPELANADFAYKASAQGDTSPKMIARYVHKADYLWIALLGFIVIINIWFGIHNHGEAQKVAATKQNAESVLQWFTENGPAREKGESLIAGCNEQKNLWQECLAALSGQDGPFQAFHNVLEPSGRVFSEACDRADLKTLGSIVIEKGTPKPLDPSAMTYAKMPANQPLGAQLPLRIFVCGRSFHSMGIGEIVF